MKYLFYLFCGLLVWLCLASFLKPLGLGPVRGFRMYESIGQYICRANFYNVIDAGSAKIDERIYLKNILGDLGHVKQASYRIYDWDWARKKGEEVCLARPDFKSLRIDLSCRTDFGFSPMKSEELKCR